MARKTKRFSPALTALLCIVLLLVGTVAGFVGYAVLTMPKEQDPIPGGSFSVHMIDTGLYNAGDCIYIKAGDTDILIDGGAKTKNVGTIQAYLDAELEDGILEYVIVTHAHEDHYACFSIEDGSLFDLYECKTIIDFAMTNQTDGKMYRNYLAERDAEIAAGATHYTAADCISGGNNVFEIAPGVTMTVLDSYFYTHKSASENNYSVCLLFEEGDRSYLFTGDLEKDGEQHLIEMNSLSQVTFYKAGHHGSKTSSSDAFLAVIRPEIVAVSCCAGTSEYTSVANNQFPTQQFIDSIAPYTRRVYVASVVVDDEQKTFRPLNGTVVLRVGGGGLSVECSASDTLLYESEWFAATRVCPAAWRD